MIKFCSQVFLLVLVCITVGLLYQAGTYKDKELRYQWETFPKQDLEPETIGKTIKKLKPDFLFGSSTASHQIEGNSTNNNWWKWEQKAGVIHNGDKSGMASNSYKLYKTDAKLAGKDGIGGNSYRFSIAWGKIQPTQKLEFDQEVVEHYHDLIRELRKNGAEPMITLHHFTQPQWFSDIGAFEKEENIEVFLKFSEFIFKEYMIKDKVKLWCSFNEPGNYVGGGYIVGMFPPGRWNLLQGLEVYKNIFKTHIKVYKQQKRILREYNQKNPTALLTDVKIGIVKNYAAFDPFSKINGIEIVAAKISNFFFNEIFFRFFNTGVFYVPLLAHYENKEAMYSNDYLGLNYYTNINWRFSWKTFLTFDTAEEHKHLVTDFGYALYAEGLWRGLSLYKNLDLPIIITENGIAQKEITGDKRRVTWITRHLYIVVKAIKAGIPIDGYYYWSLMDNFEWAEGYKMRFGLYHVDFKTFKRTLREGSQSYVRVLKAFNKA